MDASSRRCAGENESSFNDPGVRVVAVPPLCNSKIQQCRGEIMEKKYRAEGALRGVAYAMLPIIGYRGIVRGLITRLRCASVLSYLVRSERFRYEGATQLHQAYQASHLLA